MGQGEDWLFNLDPTTGAEMRKTSPAVIVSSNLIGVLPLPVIAPLTDWKDRYAVAPWIVRIEPSPAMGWRKNRLRTAFRYVRCSPAAWCANWAA